MPSLKVAWVLRRKSASSIPNRPFTAWMMGTVASPTPTVPISSDSISTMSMPARARNRARTAAAIQPAVPPPTMAARRINESELCTNRERVPPVCIGPTVARCQQGAAHIQISAAVQEIGRLDTHLDVAGGRDEQLAIQLAVVLRPDRRVDVRGRGGQQVALAPVPGETRADSPPLIHQVRVITPARHSFEGQCLIRRAIGLIHIQHVQCRVAATGAVDEGQIALESQPRQRTGEKVEELLIGKLEAADPALGAVLVAHHLERFSDALGRKRLRIVARENVVANTLVEEIEGEAAGRREIPFQAAVELVRASRFQLGIAALARLTVHLRRQIPRVTEE